MVNAIQAERQRGPARLVDIRGKLVKLVKKRAQLSILNNGILKLI